MRDGALSSHSHPSPPNPLFPCPRGCGQGVDDDEEVVQSTHNSVLEACTGLLQSPVGAFCRQGGRGKRQVVAWRVVAWLECGGVAVSFFCGVVVMCGSPQACPLPPCLGCTARVHRHCLGERGPRATGYGGVRKHRAAAVGCHGVRPGPTCSHTHTHRRSTLFVCPHRIQTHVRLERVRVMPRFPLSRAPAHRIPPLPPINPSPVT